MIRNWISRVLSLAPDSFDERSREDLLATYEARFRETPTGWRRPLFVLREMSGATWLVVRLWTGRDPSENRIPGMGRGDTIRQDVRFAFRTLRRHPGFTAATLTVLAVGIGANVAIFSAVNAFLFRPLPFADPDRLVTVYETNPDFGWVDEVAAPANILDWREQVEAFADVSAYGESVDDMTAFRDGEPVIVTGTEVMGNFFSTLGLAFVRG